MAVWEEEEKDAEKDVILPPDVLDVALAMLCAPLTVRHVGDLRGREAHFNCPTATVRLHTTDYYVEEALRRMTANMPRGAVGDSGGVRHKGRLRGRVPSETPSLISKAVEFGKPWKSVRAFLKAESNSCVKATIRRAKKSFLVHQAMGFPLIVAIDVQANEIRDTKHAVWHYRRDDVPIEDDSESADPCAIAEVAKIFCYFY